MIPVLLNLPFLKLYTFGIFLVLAFFWGSFLLWKNIRLTSYKEDDIFDGLFTTLSGGLLGGRLLYVVLNFDQFGFNPLKFILINGYPGLSLLGAIAGGFLALFLFFKMRRLDLLQVIDCWASPVLVALAIGKLGSFFSGVEIGIKTTFFLSLKYTGYEGLRHLTPFYEAIFFFVGAAVAHKLLSEIRKERLIHGFGLTYLVWWISADYFVFDKVKNNHLYLAGISLNSVVSGFFLLTLSLYFIYYFRSKFLLNKHEANNRNSQKTKKSS